MSQINTSNEAWRLECEARHVIALPNKERRQVYLLGVEKRRGEAGRTRLENEVLRLWNKKG